MGNVSGSLLEQRGVQAQFGAYVVAAVFDNSGGAAFGLGDGTLRTENGPGNDWLVTQVSAGAILSLAQGGADQGLICGSDDGRFAHVAKDGTIVDIARWPGKWVDHVASVGVGSGGLLACTVGRKLYLFNVTGIGLKTLDHPSTVTGIGFDAKGKRIASSHYNGVSLWYTSSKTDNPRRLEWKGSHTGIAFHPGGEAVVTSMQENALHGWRLSDGQHMRMTGYPAKTESLSFTRGGKWLASSGADTIVLWPFFGGGPMGKAPTELAGGKNILCTKVACHVKHDCCAAGFADGSVVLADVTTGKIVPIAPTGYGPVSAIAWSGDGSRLAFGTEGGFAAVVTFAAA